MSQNRTINEDAIEKRKARLAIKKTNSETHKHLDENILKGFLGDDFFQSFKENDGFEYLNRSRDRT
jgi:hypothetical protein